MTTPKVRERERLELSFVRARWLAVAAITGLMPFSGSPAILIVALAGFAGLGNVCIWLSNSRLQSLQAQRNLGVAAVALDATVVLAASLWAHPTGLPAIFGALIIVVAEISVRFSQKKAILGTGAIMTALATTMAARQLTMNDPFDPVRFIVISCLAIIVGTMIGSAVQEVYRHRVTAMTPKRNHVLIDMPAEAYDILTTREQQVLSLIGRGYSNALIANTLIIEHKTVKNHINRIYSKLALNSRYEAITAVLQQIPSDD